MSVAAAFLRLSVVCGVVGMAAGIGMGVTHDFTLAPAHAHLNLLGWVSMMLFGLFYQHRPEAAANRLASAHLVLNAVGVAAQVSGLALILSGRRWAEPVLDLGASAVMASMLIFGVIVFRVTRTARAPATAATPAE